MKTKSLSLLIALALCITIGGVYAAWIYAEAPLTAVHGHIGSFGLTNAEVNHSKGTITVNASGAHLTIDQTAENDYSAKLVPTGEIVVTLNPSSEFLYANPDLTEFAMNYKLVTTNTAPLAFTCTNGNSQQTLFSKFDTTTETSITLVKQADNTFQATIPATELSNLISINDFTLDTYAKYELFSTEIGQFGNIGISVSEA